MNTLSEVMADLSASVRARTPIIWVVSREETRVKPLIFDAVATAGYEGRFWSITKGFTFLNGRNVTGERGKDSADDALDYIGEQTGTEDSPNRNVWVMCDLPVWITAPAGIVTQRRLRELAEYLPAQSQWASQSIVILSPSAEVPDELADATTVIEWPLPDREVIAGLLDATVETLPAKLQKTAVNGQRDAAIDAAIGLSGEQAQSAFARSLVKSRKVDPASIASEKERAIRGAGLEWLKSISNGMEGVGGLDNWKEWVVSFNDAYTPAAREYGLETPKGVVLLGVPGCGKTLSAKALAGEWKVPLIKLDLGALKGKYVGQSEASIRNAFARIEAIGRCVVLVDEIEKALAGASGDAGDGGVAADALGALLSWMQDRSGEAFVIATANNVDKLPPELLRKGRFDEIWWIGLPTQVERAGVIRAALAARGRDADAIGIDLQAIAKATDQFSGAEIDALVPTAMRAAFAENAREITTADILKAAKSVKPKGTDKVRPDFAQEATSTTVAAAASSGRALDI